MAEFVVQWTEVARMQVERMNEARFKGDAKAWHERMVKRHAQKIVPEATRARIRCVLRYGHRNSVCEHLALLVLEGLRTGAYQALKLRNISP